MVDARYTREEAEEALRESLPDQAIQGPPAKNQNIDETDLQQHHENLLCQEERIREEIRQRFRRARNVDHLFTTFMAHIPLLFMHVQDKIRRENM